MVIRVGCAIFVIGLPSGLGSVIGLSAPSPAVSVRVGGGVMKFWISGLVLLPLITRETIMTKAQARSLLMNLTNQLDVGFQRIVELETSSEFGLPHTMMREQVNATYGILMALKTELPVPYDYSDFRHFLAIMDKWQPKKRFGWWSYL